RVVTAVLRDLALAAGVDGPVLRHADDVWDARVARGDAHERGRVGASVDLAGLEAGAGVSLGVALDVGGLGLAVRARPVAVVTGEEVLGERGRGRRAVGRPHEPSVVVDGEGNEVTVVARRPPRGVDGVLDRAVADAGQRRRSVGRLAVLRGEDDR